MRRHFHRCGSLRIVSMPAAALHGDRKGGGVVLEELCEARRLTPCVGLAECDILTPGQKQELLVERATRIRAETGRADELSGVARERGIELEALRDELASERSVLVEENLRRAAELAAAEDRGLSATVDEEPELAEAGLSPGLDPSLSPFRIERLDRIDRVLDAMESPDFGTCALCGGEIEMPRLRLAPETRVCGPCAGRAVAPHPVAVRGLERPARVVPARRPPESAAASAPSRTPR